MRILKSHASNENDVPLKGNFSDFKLFSELFFKEFFNYLKNGKQSLIFIR